MGEDALDRMMRPAGAVLAVHGAGSSPSVFDGWHRWFSVPFHAVDLQVGLDVTRAGMADYTGRVVRVALTTPEPVALVGWSMGGLVVMLTARWLDANGCAPTGLVLIEASAPREVVGFRPSIAPTDGVFDPEEAYGAFPPDQPARPESVRARAERKRGVSVVSLPSPALVVSGRDFPDERGQALASSYGAQHRSYPALDHWELVRDPRIAAAAAEFLGVGKSEP